MTDRFIKLRRFAVPLLACVLIAGCHAHGYDRSPQPGYYGWRGPDRHQDHRPTRWDWKRDHDRDGDRGRHWRRD